MHKPQRPTKPDLTPPTTPRPETVQLRARRSPRLIALGLLLVAGGGIGAAALVGSGDDVVPLVVMAADVRRGDVIGDGDLTVIELPASSGVQGMPAADLPSLVGERALMDLPKGAFPLARHVGAEPLPAGQTLVGLRLPIGKLPATELPPGTAVRVVGVGDGTQTTVDAVVARAPSLLDDGTSFALDVRVADAEADLVARLAAGDQVALVLVGGV
ncbi:SAF domain-containing protein [Tessaracoccus defluvii]|uniref:SAF domain-containing protein n=1 Tax=Tessaracoccus defluvii TaxID=1285901 RepID=A0A7H0H502_9ACTN|nr:SAF domain-containing protein [Tessaracoccus defluvii]QNP55618.1 hypothetical protein H9L22_15840 [Tessaracoccus defluvii]